MKDKSINYWESRTINVGNYEKIQCQLSYTVHENAINNIESTVEISHSEVIESIDTFKADVKKVVSRVKKVLDSREATIRNTTSKFTEYPDEGYAKLKLLKKKKKKKVEVFKKLEDDLDLD